MRDRVGETGRRARGALGREFGMFWAAYAVSAAGTWVAFDAFPIIAILVLHAGPTEVSALAAAGLAVGAVVAVPLGPWVEARRKGPVMVAMDLLRFGALMSVPIAYALGALSFAQLLLVSILAAAANITFRAASGPLLKGIVHQSDLLAANARLESTSWTATMLGPPIGGAAIGLLGPVVTVIVDATSYLLSAAGISAIGRDRRPAQGEAPGALSEAPGAQDDAPGAQDDAPGPARAGRRRQVQDLVEGWRHTLSSGALRPLFFNRLIVNGLIMATAPLLAVLMLGRLGFAPWEYGLAFAAPCVGGLLGSRLASRLVARLGQRQVLLGAGTLRACWSLGLAFIPAGASGLALVIGIQLGLVTCAGVFNPVLATYRLQQVDKDKLARTLSAWSVSSSLTIACLTALWGLLAEVTSVRAAIALAGLLMLTSPLLLLRWARQPSSGGERQWSASGAVGEADGSG